MEEKNCSLTFFPVNLTGPRMLVKEVVLFSKFRSRAQPQHSVQKAHFHSLAHTKQLLLVTFWDKTTGMELVIEYTPTETQRIKQTCKLE